MRWRWVPNALTLTRIALVPFLAMAIIDEHYRIAFALFFLAGVSDLADGMLARHFRWQTRLGSLIDPLADKLLFAAVFIVLVLQGKVALWLGVMVVLRDVIIISGATFYNFAVERLVGTASLLGKLNTLVLGCYVLLILFDAAGPRLPNLVMTMAQWLVVALLVISCAHYVWLGVRLARQRSIHDRDV